MVGCWKEGTMGFGSLNGNINGFAASSNLSPLAPPFTVDHRPSRSPLNINAAPFVTWGNSQSLDSHQSTSASENVTSSLFPSYTRPAEPHIDSVVYSSSAGLTDSISFNQFPTSLMTSDFGEGNYYAEPSHWSTFSVVSRDGFGCSSPPMLNGVGSTLDNYMQSLYGLEYPSQSCNGRLDFGSEENNSYLDRIAPEVTDRTNTSTYRDYFNEGSELPKLLGKSSLEPWVPKINTFSILQQNPVGSLGTDAVVDKPFPEFNAKGTYASSFSNPSGTSGISFAATPDKPIMDSWDHFIEPSATSVTVNKQCFSNQSPPVLTSFHEASIKHPSVVVTSSTTSRSLAPESYVMHIGNDLYGKCDDIAYDCLYNVTDPWVCQRSKQGQEINKYEDIGAGIKVPQRYDTSAVLFPTKYGASSVVKNVTSSPLDIFKHEAADMHDNMHNQEGFGLLIDESDQCNPSEDSPCWRGSSSYFPQFQVSEPIPSQNRESKNSYDESSLIEAQTFPFSCKIPTTVSSTDFYGSTNGGLGETETLISSSERACIGNHLLDESKSDVTHAVTKLGATERNSGNGLCFPSDNHVSVEADAVVMEPCGVKKSELCNPIRLCLETIYCEADKEKQAECLINTDANLNHAPEECQSYVPSNAAKQVLSSLPFDADISSRHYQENWDTYATESKSMLLKTIVNLSDSLLFYYLNDENPVGNDDYKILEMVLSKLTMCLKFTEEKSSANECLTHKPVPSNVSNEVQASHDPGMTYKPQVTKGKYHEDSAMLGSSAAGFCKPARADDKEEACSMTKAIKDILDANFHEDTESHPIATMYKNLWLEAEAVLCSTNYKARYHHMKNEMMKTGSHKEKEKSMECKVSPSQAELFQESSSMGKPVHATDIMERYNILKCRIGTSDKGLGGELGSSNTASDQKTVDQVSCHTTSETFIKDANYGCQSQTDPDTIVPGNHSTSSTSTYHADLAEDHLISRLQILKSRGDYPKSAEPAKQSSSLTMDSVGEKDFSPECRGELLDGRFDPTIETGMTKATIVSSSDDDGFEGVDCLKFARNSEMAELGAQFSGSWYENTSSDWEHVLKDEFTLLGRAVNP